jgi:hypothetical protein
MNRASGIAASPATQSATELEPNSSMTQLPLPYLEAEVSPRPDGFIPIYEPWLGQREEELVLETVRSTWISSAGKYIKQLEEEFAAYCGAAYGIATSNGTTSLHLATHALGIGEGDEVIVPSLTFVACANAIKYTGAPGICRCGSGDVDTLA